MIMMNGPFASARSLMWRPKLRCNHCPLRRWLLLMLLQGDGTPSGLSGALNVVTFCWILPARLLRCNLIGGILGTVNRMFLIVWMLLLGMLFWLMVLSPILFQFPPQTVLRVFCVAKFWCSSCTRPASLALTVGSACRCLCFHHHFRVVHLFLFVAH